jgi:hypothetical protein
VADVTVFDVVLHSAWVSQNSCYSVASAFVDAQEKALRAAQQRDSAAGTASQGAQRQEGQDQPGMRGPLPQQPPEAAPQEAGGGHNGRQSSAPVCIPGAALLATHRRAHTLAACSHAWLKRSVLCSLLLGWGCHSAIIFSAQRCACAKLG